MAKEFNASNFDAEVLNAQKPVLIDFWAPWCGPCKAIAPALEELAETMKETITIGKVNVDDCPDIAGRYGIMSIPTLLIFRNGAVINQIVGALSKKDLQDRITAALKN
ncbi:MAG: thioredoxin [Candidatus Raymondbacteria bacterium RifOxyA12_full_50_37]|uniref:Thioredoxin n=1 Tax=Candidatus Raymondbacteria bacterium RIFOXYD12_FULL_49_13 TaxID=1817890 RepID=A0A1F7FDB2_UNCRA|nr:MAG: thioredoxin [Candidatus Raymondbacteria bacterium RifOxyA12_full_50_37]OGJ94082.1 MAG: thioredoxin [Candidatus Raymondbacteria bacterium RIFOXYA2_FULL_49_16]OGJ96837.1 MAG: thioredoxin [Candidatus Raymondbacteria bacterium RifOxyC12_full_50_8]OGJ96907.1 MAG: thioredoxin [Candidatus Raymondbacteria bacterium RIFOXYC2_FULL_50_21]OGK01503.1 MAG: thioredoxin [Candidatus Raymondbacteria bacterium RifOxyB12_full_50_8]OGK04633.1 MAG: thioredoxin [Candidatus Raymondbacteria bacterium RIFOXYD12